MDFLDKTGLARLWQHILAKLNNKVDKVDGKGLSTNDFTDEEKNKLSNIEAGATKIIVDGELSESSENPVMNSVINAAIVDLNTKIEAIPPTMSIIATDDGNGNVSLTVSNTNIVNDENTYLVVNN